MLREEDACGGAKDSKPGVWCVSTCTWVCLCGQGGHEAEIALHIYYARLSGRGQVQS